MLLILLKTAYSMNWTRTYLLALICLWQTCLVAQTTDIFNDPQKMYTQALEWMDEEKYPMALEYFEKLSMNEQQFDPNIRNHAKFYQAHCAMELRNQDGISLMTLYLDKNPGSIHENEANVALADHYYRVRDYKNALVYINKINERDIPKGEQEDFKFKKGYALFFNKRFKESTTYFGKLNYPGGKYYVQSTYYLGTISYFNEDYDAALTYFEKIQDQRQYQRVVPYYLADINFMKGNYDEVIRTGEPLINDTKQKYRTELNRLVGQSYFQKQNYSKALPYLEYYVGRRAKVSKDDLYSLAITQYKTENYEKAINNLKDLNVLKTAQGQNAQYYLADCYLKLNDKKNARLAFQSAANRDFDASIKEVSTFNFAKLSAEQGYEEDAINGLQRFATSYPNSTYYRESQEILSDLFLTTRNYVDAIQIIEKINNPSPKIKEALQKVAYFRGVELFGSNKEESARLFYKSLQNPYDRDFEALAHFWQAELFFGKENYAAAKSHYNDFLDNASASRLDARANADAAHYGIGYSELRENDYKSANRHFTQIQNSGSRLFKDASLRSSDCYLMLGNKEAAYKGYKAAVNNNFPSADYAMFQQGILEGLLNRDNDKIKTLQGIRKRYPKSLYIDDAIYEVGNTLLLNGNSSEAIKEFNNLIRNYSNSSFTRKSYVKLGLIYFNNNQLDRALDHYGDVLKKYPNTAEAGEAIVGIRDIYIERGDAEGYLDYVNGVPGNNISQASADSITYAAAETFYAKGDCDNTERTMTNYLNKYPNGLFQLSALFYRADCAFRNDKFDVSLNDYETIALKSNNRFTERALLKSGYINFYKKKNYERALSHYEKVIQGASNVDFLLDAYMGSIRSSYKTGKNGKVKKYAEEVVLIEELNENDRNELHYYLGKVYLDANNWSKAKEELQIIANNNQGVQGAEARYLIATATYKANDLTAAQEQCFEIINKDFAHDYWFTKTFILLADIYRDQDELYQAQATLQSVIDNYSGDQAVIDEAKRKLKQIEEMQLDQSKLDLNSDDGVLEIDSIPDFE